MSKTQAERSRDHARKRPTVSPRVDAHVKDALAAEAARRGVSIVKLAEIFIVEGLQRETQKKLAPHTTSCVVPPYRIQ